MADARPLFFFCLFVIGTGAVGYDPPPPLIVEPRAAPTAPTTTFFPFVIISLSSEGPLFDVIPELNGENGTNTSPSPSSSPSTSPSSSASSSLGFWTC